LKIYSVPKEK